MSKIEKTNKELLKGSASTLVMKLLKSRSMYGYEIIKEIHSRSEGAFELKEGSLYPILHTLEQDELLESYWEESQSERKRKYYRLTKKGKTALLAKEKEWLNFRTAIDRILTEMRVKGGAYES